MSTSTSSEIVACPRCGARNRVTPEQRQKTPVCGKCRTPLPAATEPLEVTDHNFEELVGQSRETVLLDMWAPWCGPCRMIAPTIVQLAGEFSGRARVGKLNTDLNPTTAARFHIASVPTLLIFRNGQEVDRIVGLAPAEEIRRRLQAALT